MPPASAVTDYVEVTVVSAAGLIVQDLFTSDPYVTV
eukprot:gene47949-8748_t